MTCTESSELLQERLDGNATADLASLEQHLAACPACRERHAAAERLRRGLLLRTAPTAPDGLTDLIVAGVLRDRRLRRRRRWLTAAVALAASLLLALAIWQRSSTETPVVEVVKRDTPAPTVPMSLNESVAEAGSAVADLTRRTAGETLDNTRDLLPMTVPETSLASAGDWQQTLEPPTRSLREVGQIAATGLEPVTGSARRAVDLFLRELPTVKPNDKQGS
jgi:predicted anti-sigma-YlaC factor YlaD